MPAIGGQPTHPAREPAVRVDDVEVAFGPARAPRITTSGEGAQPTGEVEFLQPLEGAGDDMPDVEPRLGDREQLLRGCRCAREDFSSMPRPGVGPSEDMRR